MGAKLGLMMCKTMCGECKTMSDECKTMLDESKTMFDKCKTMSNDCKSRFFAKLQKMDKSIRHVCKTPLTSMYFHVCEKNYPASPS